MVVKPGDGFIQAKAFSSCTTELKTIRDFVEQACSQAGMAEEQQALVILAIDEACANVIRHGYKMAESGCMELEIAHKPEYVVFTIKDRCQEISDSDLNPKPKALDVPGGLGLHLMHSVAESVRLVPHDGPGNWLELVVKLENPPT